MDKEGCRGDFRAILGKKVDVAVSCVGDKSEQYRKQLHVDSVSAGKLSHTPKHQRKQLAMETWAAGLSQPTYLWSLFL